MSAVTKDLRDDVHKSPEQLEREADSARNALEGTLSALEQRLSPGEMLDRVMDMVKRNGGEFGDNLLTQVRNNPLPTIIAGVGVAWLIASSKRPPPRGRAQSRSSGHSDFDKDDFDRNYGGDEDIDATERWLSAATSAHNGAAPAAGSARDAASSAKHSATDAMHRATDSASRMAHRAADATRHAAQGFTDGSRAGLHGMSDGYAYMSREQPFVLGALALAAGAALGALLPTTAAENNLVGAASDAAKSRARSEARARTSELRQTAEDVARTVKDEIAQTAESMESEEPAGASESEAAARTSEARSEPQPGASSASLS